MLPNTDSRTIKKIHSTKDKVTELLRLSQTYRDSDEKLVVRFWWDELAHLDTQEANRKTYSMVYFFEKYASGQITSADVITRARRKAQQENPDLRGKTWKERRSQQTQVRSYIKD